MFFWFSKTKSFKFFYHAWAGSNIQRASNLVKTEKILRNKLVLVNVLVNVTFRFSYVIRNNDVINMTSPHFPLYTSFWDFQQSRKFFKKCFKCPWQQKTVDYHYVKSVQIQSYFSSVFSCIRTEYGDLLIQENTALK